MERLTKLIVKDNDGYNYAMTKEQQYVIDCNLGATNINIVELTREHEEGYLYKHYYAQGEAVEKLAEYENAEEQGLLVRLSHKPSIDLSFSSLKSEKDLLGDDFPEMFYKDRKLYLLVDKIDHKKKKTYEAIEVVFVYKIVIEEEKPWLIMKDIKGAFFDVCLENDDFMQKVFKTKAEALQALKERE